MKENMQSHVAASLAGEILPANAEEG